MKKNTFHVYVKGDHSVGIFGGNFKVTFEDNYVWDAEMIESAKQALADHYDTPVTKILTTEEYDQETLNISGDLYIYPKL